MSLNPEILSLHRDDDSLSLDLRIPEDLTFFRGHFPGMPILPGVVQVDWAIRFAREHLGIPTDGFGALKALKFSAPVRPGDRLALRLDWRPEKVRLDFAYTAGEKKYASGQALFPGAAPR